MKKNSISPKIKKVPLQKADIIKTNGDNKKLKDMQNLQSIQIGKKVLKN